MYELKGLGLGFKGFLRNVNRLYLYSKQLLDEVFVTPGIIKVELSVISRAEGRG